MKFFDVIQSLDENVYINFLRNYDETDTTKGIYLNAFRKLKSMLPETKTKDYELLIFKHKNTEYDREYVVEAIKNKKHMDRVPSNYEELETYIERYSVSFIPWSEVLNYRINMMTKEKLTPEIIVTVIIDELTDFGIDEESISKRKIEIEQALDEAELDIELGNVFTIEDTRTEKEKEEAYQKMKKQVDIAMQLYFEHITC